MLCHLSGASVVHLLPGWVIVAKVSVTNGGSVCVHMSPPHPK